MLNINTLLDDIISELKSSSDFNNAVLVKAYPPAVKPTRINKLFIALGISEINLHSSQVESCERAGQVSLFADIFIPLKMDSSCACEIFTQICRSLSSYNVLTVSASRLTVDERVQANVLKVNITFNDEIFMGGGSNG